MSTAETFSTSWTVRTLPLETTRNATGVTETPAPLPPPNICLLEFGGGSGAGVSVTPVAFLVVSNGNVRTVQLVEKVSAVDNVIASLPELVDKVAALIKKEKPGADAPADKE